MLGRLDRHSPVRIRRRLGRLAFASVTVSDSPGLARPQTLMACSSLQDRRDPETGRAVVLPFALDAAANDSIAPGSHFDI